MKNTCAASTRAAGNSRDCHRKAPYHSAAKVHRSDRHWNNSGGCCCSSAEEVHWSAHRSNSSADCRCSWVRKGRCCLRAGRHYRPMTDDRSSRGRAVTYWLNSSRLALGDHPWNEARSALGHLRADSNRRSLAERARGQWHCLVPPKCVNYQAAARDCCSPQVHSWSGCPALPMGADSARVRADAWSFQNLPAHYCRADSRTDR